MCRSIVTQSAEPLQTVKGININNLLEFVKPFHLNKLGFYQFSGEKKRLSILEIEFSKYCLDPSDSTTVSN